MLVFLFSGFFFSYFILMGIFACLYIFIPCEFSAQGGQKRMWGLLELELHMVVSCHVAGGNQQVILTAELLLSIPHGLLLKKGSH